MTTRRGNDPTEDATLLPEDRIIEPEDMVMPVYEWRCNKCSYEFEKLKPMSQFDEDEYCPKCGYVAQPMATLPAKAVIKESIHADSGIPQRVHDSLTNRTNELYDVGLARQGREIQPEDM